MTVSVVQQVQGTGTTLTLNGVTAGNLLVLFGNYFRAPSTGAVEGTPTDTNGTFSVANSDVPATFNAGGVDLGTGIFYEENAAAGTHVVTPQANGGRNCTLVEFSGLLTSGSFDVAKSAKTNDSTQTSQVTGTTNTTTQANELVVISLALGADIGNADVGFTDPVSGFTTLSKTSNDASDIGAFQAYKVIAGTGTQSATFNWTDNEIHQASHGAIATFKAAAGGGGGATQQTLQLLGVGP